VSDAAVYFGCRCFGRFFVKKCSFWRNVTSLHQGRLSQYLCGFWLGWQIKLRLFLLRQAYISLPVRVSDQMANVAVCAAFRRWRFYEQH